MDIAEVRSLAALRVTEAFSPNWHFTGAVGTNGFLPINLVTSQWRPAEPHFQAVRAARVSKRTR
jgi:hypothetical protein